MPRHARSYARRVFPVMLVLAVSLTASTLYLQAHYAVDAIAGGVIGFAAWAVSERLHDHRRRVTSI